MSKAITIDNLGFEASVEWARALEVADAKYITEVPFVPRKTQQAIIDQMTPSQMEQLCDLRKSPPWAAFTPSKDYAYRLKSLFQGKLIPHFDLGASMERLDAFFEEGEIADEEEVVAVEETTTEECCSCQEEATVAVEVAAEEVSE